MLERLAEKVQPAGIVVARFGTQETEIRSYGGLEPDARVEIGSVTKLFTARLLTLLAADGVVRLDEPAVDCLGPGWRLGRRVTLERLASHRAGLPRLPRRVWRSLLRDGHDPYRTLTVEDLQASLPPRLPRPRRRRYSNFGAALLAHALATRAGAPWRELIGERITRPLELRDTSANGPVAQPHSSRGRPVPPWNLGAMEGAGALRSTAADLCVFALSAESSLGWMREGEVWWHNGGTGGSAAFVGWQPGRRAGVVALANAAISGPLTRIGLRTLRG